MAAIVIEDLWKEYRLGVIGHGTLTHDLQSWWARARGKEDPNAKMKPFLAGQEKQVDGDHFWALRGINLEVIEGEILGIIGKNGAGKSTLLKVLSRVTAPTRGTIKVKGRIASLLEVGTGFHPELTGRENIFMNGAILGMSKKEIFEKLDEIIEFSGVEQFIDTPVKRYSSGMYVRLAFAVAAHLETEILVVDEVLAVGDAEFQNKCLGKMNEVAGDGRTVLFVSHNLEMIEKLCLKAVLLMNGQISISGSTQAVLNSYAEFFVKEKTENLLELVERIGFGKIKFSRVEFFDSDGRYINIARVGSFLRIRVHFINVSKRKHQAIRFSVSIKSYQKDLINLDTSVADGRKLTVEDDGFLDFLVPRLPLTSGFYQVGLTVRTEQGKQDFIEHAKLLNVDGGSFFESGKNCVKGFEMKQVIVEHKVEYSWC
jgi:lipopolysaccharide transport system ATP-binding protein